jgi:large subunit ribosomal protein L4
MIMIELPILDLHGKKIDVLKIDESTLGGEIRHALLKQAYVTTHTNQRQGSARTKGRGSVNGSTRKLYNQKGTGNSRVGASRIPGRKGGGVAFEKTRDRDAFRSQMTRKMRRLANRNALLAKLVDGEVKCFSDLAFKQPQTKAFAAVLKTIGIDRSCLVALDGGNENARLSARNIDNVTVTRIEQLNAFDLLNHRFMVVDKASLQAFIDGSALKGTKESA